MKKTWITLIVLAIVAGGAAGVLTAFSTESYLNRYAQSLEDGSVPPRLGDERARTLPTSQGESLNKIRENVLPAMVRWHRAIPETSSISRGSYIDDNAIGSGVIISSDGWVMTTQDIFTESQATNMVAVVGSRVYEVVDTKVDTATDLMLVKVEAENLPVISFGESSHLEVGDSVFVVESIYKFTQSNVFVVEPSVTLIEFSENLSSRITLDDIFNESSIVVNTGGEIVGVIDNGEVQPFKVLYPAIQQVLRDGEVERPRLGVRVLMLDQAIGHSSFGSGALVVERPAFGTPAREAEIEINDVILNINGRDVGGAATISMLLLDYVPGDIVTLHIKRDLEEVDVDVELDLQP